MPNHNNKDLKHILMSKTPDVENKEDKTEFYLNNFLKKLREKDPIAFEKLSKEELV